MIIEIIKKQTGYKLTLNKRSNHLYKDYSKKMRTNIIYNDLQFNELIGVLELYRGLI